MHSTAQCTRCGARRGDWVRRMRFWSAITRGVGAQVCTDLGTRALPSKARSPDPATMPYFAWIWQKSSGMPAALWLMCFGRRTQWAPEKLHKNGL